MLETALYMRVRGRVLGPHEPEKLQAMVQRGQLSRMHELSTDAVTWVRASSFPELFVAGPDLLSAPQAEIVTNANDTETGSGLEIASTVARWYHNLGGVQNGPVSWSQLQSLAQSGQLSPEDLVWSEGMLNWQPANSISSLAWPTAASSDALAISPTDGERHAYGLVAGGVQTGSMPENVARAALAPRNWVLFIAIVLFIISGLCVLVSTGIFSLVTAIVIFVGGFLLVRYASQLGGLRYSSSPVVLERALDTLRIFWLYLGICLILAIVLFVISFILASNVFTSMPFSSATIPLPHFP